MKPDTSIETIPAKTLASSSDTKEKKSMLIAFPDMHEYCKIKGKDSRNLSSLYFLLNNYTFDYIVFFLFPHLGANKENIEALINDVAPTSKVQFIDCSEFSQSETLELALYLKHKLPEIHPHYLEQKISVSLGGFVYISLQAAILNLCMRGELPCKLIMVRPVKRLNSPLSMFDEVDFSNSYYSISEKDESLEEHRTIANQLGIIGGESFRNIFDACLLLAPTLFPILLLGETGTGKGLFAKYIHALSGRSEDTFVEVNCAAIPDNLVESILFGHKKGAFTGAISDQVGKFVQANGGTLFLDEIGDMPMATQAKILKVLEDGKVDVLGSQKPVEVNVKIIAATNSNLQEKIEEGTFRADLYYRLQIGEIKLPSLNERKEDIRAIALQTLQKFNNSLPFSKLLTDSALIALENHKWKGNVRELEMTIKRACVTSSKNIINTIDIFPEKSQEKTSTNANTWTIGTPIEPFLREIRDNAFLQALEATQGNQSAAARLLGVSHQAMNQFIKKRNKQ